MAHTLTERVTWGGVDYAPGAQIHGLTVAQEAGLVSSNRAEYVSGPVVSRAGVQVEATISAEGIELSVGRGSFDVARYGAKCDGRAYYDCATTASTDSTITPTGGAFDVGDTGKSIVILPYADTTGAVRYGSITNVNADGSCVAALSGSPGALVGATVIFGTDDADAIDAALSAAEASPVRGDVTLPLGICVTTRAHTIPFGVHLRGAGNNPTGGKAKDFRHYGSSLVLAAYQASGGFINPVGGSGDPRGVAIEGVNIDCSNLSSKCVDATYCRTVHAFMSTFVRASHETWFGGPTSRISMCILMGHNNYNVIQLSGDSTFTNNMVTGAGNGYYGVKVSNGDDIQVVGNHIWKDSSNATLLGGSVWISHWGDNATAGSISVLGNKFDTAHGAHVKISVSGSSTVARGINVSGNHASQNYSVASAAHPLIEISVDAGCSIRGLTIQNNIGRGSWDNASIGRYTAFVDASGVSGNIYGSNVGGNTIDNCDAMYLGGFAPDVDGGNITIAGTGTALVTT